MIELLNRWGSDSEKSEVKYLRIAWVAVILGIIISVVLITWVFPTIWPLSDIRSIMDFETYADFNSWQGNNKAYYFLLSFLIPLTSLLPSIIATDRLCLSGEMGDKKEVAFSVAIIWPLIMNATYIFVISALSDGNQWHLRLFHATRLVLLALPIISLSAFCTWVRYGLFNISPND